LRGGHVRNLAGHASVEQILEHLSPKSGLVLVLDEAQYLANLEKTPTEKHLVRDTLDMIHNGDVGQPVILLAAGLGTTEKAFQSLGISRYVKNCTVQLGSLDKKSERAVIQDWLIKEANAKGHPRVWIDAIAEQAHGWPQHVISYIEPALESIKSNNRQMTDEGLEFVLERGAELRVQYYQQRAQGIITEKRQSLTKALADVPLGGIKYYKDIMSKLTQEYSQKEAEDLFNKALEQGIIDERDGNYGVPIPSMQTWLLNEYGRDRIEIPREDVRVKVKRHSQDDEKDSSKWRSQR